MPTVVAIAPWYYTDLPNILLLLIIATVVAPTIIYVLKRRRIPRIEFDGYFVRQQRLMTGNIQNVNTTYFVRVSNRNNKSEGRIESCAGNIRFRNMIYRTIWDDNRRRHYSFGSMALLKLFEVHDNNLKFTHAIGETGLDVTPDFSYADNIGESISLELESARGRCPSLHTDSIRHITETANQI